MPRVVFAGVILALALGACGRTAGIGAREAMGTSAPAATAPAAPPMLTAVTTEEPDVTDQAQPTNTPAGTGGEPTPAQGQPGPTSGFQASPLVPEGTAVTGAPAPPEGVPLTPPFAARLETQIQAAKADLARRTGQAVDAIEVVEARAVVWPDGSLGCPQPDMVYPQVLVDGLFVRLRAAGQTYDYHGDGVRPLFLCGGKSGAP